MDGTTKARERERQRQKEKKILKEMAAVFNVDHSYMYKMIKRLTKYKNKKLSSPSVLIICKKYQKRRKFFFTHIYVYIWVFGIRCTDLRGWLRFTGLGYSLGHGRADDAFGSRS